jgi:hypothetical protein
MCHRVCVSLYPWLPFVLAIKTSTGNEYKYNRPRMDDRQVMHINIPLVLSFVHIAVNLAW